MLLNLVACEYYSRKTRFPLPLSDLMLIKTRQTSPLCRARIHLPHLPQMLVNGVESILLQTVEKHGDRTSNQVLLFNENKKLGLETLQFYLFVNAYVRDTN